MMWDFALGNEKIPNSRTASISDYNFVSEAVMSYTNSRAVVRRGNICAGFPGSKLETTLNLNHSYFKYIFPNEKFHCFLRSSVLCV